LGVTTEGLPAISARIRDALETATAAREEALRRCRSTIQHASRAIRALHRGDFGDADALIALTADHVAAIRDALACHPAQYHVGYVHDAQKEYAEAVLVRALIGGRPFTGHEELGIEPAAYLNGLAEAGSEGRRYVLDRLRAGDIPNADRALAVMDDIYYELISCDFPEAVTGGLRRTTDAFRAVLERTRGDLTLAVQMAPLHGPSGRGSDDAG
jgi:translin